MKVIANPNVGGSAILPPYQATDHVYARPWKLQALPKIVHSRVCL